MQDHNPIAFISKVFSSCQQALSVYEKELFAILFAVKKWHYYLITGHFLIKTDQRSLKHLLEQKVTIPLQHTWLSKLMRYDYEIVYKKGKNMWSSMHCQGYKDPSFLNLWFLQLNRFCLPAFKEVGPVMLQFKLLYDRYNRVRSCPHLYGVVLYSQGREKLSSVTISIFAMIYYSYVMLLLWGGTF